MCSFVYRLEAASCRTSSPPINHSSLRRVRRFPPGSLQPKCNILDTAPFTLHSTTYNLHPSLCKTVEAKLWPWLEPFSVGTSLNPRTLFPLARSSLCASAHSSTSARHPAVYQSGIKSCFCRVESNRAFQGGIKSCCSLALIPQVSRF